MEFDDKEENETIPKQRKHKRRRLAECDLLSKRYLLAILAFFGFLIVYAARTSLNVAIVAMVSNRTVTDSSGSIVKTAPAEFLWDTRHQGIVLSSFYYGYFITQIPGGYLAGYIGGKTLFGGGILLSALLTLITPFAARSQFHYFIIVRALIGFSEGVLYPCMHALWSRWAPPLERSKLSTMSFSGPLAGVLVGMSWSGLIVEAYGWPAIFYFFGCFGFFWCIFWFWLVTDSPFDHPTITDEELYYISDALADDKAEKQVSVIPFMDILTSVKVWAIIVAHFAENWGYYTLLTSLPTYLKIIHKFNLEEVGVFAGLPFLVMLIVVPSGGRLADFLRSSGVMSTTHVRKLFNTLGFLFQGVFLIVAGYSENKHLAVFGVTMAVGFGGLAWSGFMINHLDIAPRYAGLLLGISNCIATIPGIAGPLFVGCVTIHESKQEWRVVFLISASCFLCGAIVFLVFSTGEKQPWADFDKYDSLSISDDDDDMSVVNDEEGVDEKKAIQPEIGKIQSRSFIERKG